MKPIIGILLVAGLLLILILSSIWSGYVLSILWVWFMVPLGIAPIGISHAIGLSSIVNMFMGSRGIKTEDSNEDPSSKLHRAFWMMTLIPLLALFIGWIAHSFM